MVLLSIKTSWYLKQNKDKCWLFRKNNPPHPNPQKIKQAKMTKYKEFTIQMMINRYSTKTDVSCSLYFHIGFRKFVTYIY